MDRQYWGLNLYVWAPADPEHPSEGLCGDNNGNPNDDFGQWKSANQFSEQWRYCYVEPFSLYTINSINTGATSPAKVSCLSDAKNGEN